MPPRVDPDIGKIVWMSCRGKQGCEGKQVKIVMKFKLPMGGTTIRYKCLTCNSPFVITL